MKSLRLLPVVIFAALALLVFKGIGLVTDGGYVLSGPAMAVAEEAPTTEGSLPSEITLTDTSPMLGDEAPTIATRVEAMPAHGEVPAAGADESMPASSEPSSEDVPALDCPGAPSSEPRQPQGDGFSDKIGNALAKGCPPVAPPVNADGDALPTTKDGNGDIVPLDVAEGDSSEAALLQRLGARRAELDQREADIAMRTSLVEAAEKRLNERTRLLADLEARITALVDEKQAAEDAQFKAVVGMYEAMKPKDAAKIFDTIDVSVLLKIARTINPRKMSPILADMSAQRANELTVAMASVDGPTSVSDTGENLAQLPQIVGH